MRVQRVPSVNTSTWARPTTATCANRTRARGVRLHRAGHVAQEHHAARPVAGAAVDGAERLAAGAQRPADGRANVDRAALLAGGPVATGGAPGADQPQVAHEAVRLVELIDAAPREVLRPQEVPIGPAQGEGGPVDRLGLGAVGRWRFLVGVQQQRDRLRLRWASARPRPTIALRRHTRRRGRRQGCPRAGAPAWRAPPSTRTSDGARRPRRGPRRRPGWHPAGPPRPGRAGCGPS